VVNLPGERLTTETQRTLRMHREEVVYFPNRLVRVLDLVDGGSFMPYFTYAPID
jgi:hypothetical protein